MAEAPRRNGPEALASALFGVVLAGVRQLAGYHYYVGIDELERTRLDLSSSLLPISVSHGLAWMTANERVRRTVGEACEIYLDRMRDQDQIVRAGDYVVWGIEQQAVSRIFRERFCDLISPALFDAHQVRYGLLVRVISEARKQTQQGDVKYAMMTAPKDDVRGFLGVLGVNMAASFTKHILRMDPFAPPGSDERTRYNVSVANAAPFISHIYMETMKLLKQVEG